MQVFLLKYGSELIFLGWRLIWGLITLKCGCSDLKAAVWARETAAGWSMRRVKQVYEEEECSQFTDTLTPGQLPVDNWFTLLFIAGEALNHNQPWQTAPGGAEKWRQWPCLAFLTAPDSIVPDRNKKETEAAGLCDSTCSIPKCRSNLQTVQTCSCTFYHSICQCCTQVHTSAFTNLILCSQTSFKPAQLYFKF